MKNVGCVRCAFTLRFLELQCQINMLTSLIQKSWWGIGGHCISLAGWL